MIKPFTNCPKCRLNNLEVQFTIVMREMCHHCDFLTQRRITPLVQGGRGMLEHLVGEAMANEENLPILGTVLQQQLARVERRQAQRGHGDNGGSSRKEEDRQ